MILKKLSLYLLLLTLLSSCAVRSKNALFTSPTDVITDTLKTVYVVNDQGEKDQLYRIKPEDLLSIRNLQNMEFGAQEGTVSSSTASKPSFYVDQDGTVLLPVIGKVGVAGLTRREATEKLQDAFAKNLLKDPIIELSIINLKVSILGAVRLQGNYLLERDYVTLTDILSEAGGLTEEANPKTVKIIRGKRDNAEIIYVNLQDFNSLSSKKLILKNNDLIYIEPKRVASKESVQNVMTIIQPVFLLLNMVVLLYNLR